MAELDNSRILRDPNFVRSRIFIGNIAPNVTKQEIEDIFSKYSTIKALLLNRGFAFLQFDNEISATEAVKNEQGRMLQNRKLDVKLANRGKNKSPERDRSPVRDNIGSGPPRMGRPGIPPGLPKERTPDWREPNRFDNHPTPGRALPVPPRDKDIFPSTAYPIGKGPFGNPVMGSPAHAPIAPVDRINDCEILVFDKIVTEYAEFIELRLKKQGLMVDLLFPNEAIPLGRVLANISGRGTLYAIIVTMQNEEHRSITVNILHGQPQEHRNMPVMDAINLILRNYEVYLRGERGGLGASTLGPTFDRHPEAVQTLLNLLQQNRQLTVLQYDKIIRYLQEKREIQVKIELGDTKDVPPLANPLDQSLPPGKQTDLQNRILSILNKNSSMSNPAATNRALSNAMSTNEAIPSILPAPAPLLNDPSVQKALDNLIQGDLLRKLPSTGNLNPGAPKPMFGAFNSGQEKQGFNVASGGGISMRLDENTMKIDSINDELSETRVRLLNIEKRSVGSKMHTTTFGQDKNDIPRFTNKERRNPMKFLNRLEEFIDFNFVTDFKIIKNILQIAFEKHNEWLDLVIDDVEDFPHFKARFKAHFWGDHAQSLLRQRIEIGWFNEKLGKAMSTYALELINLAKYLDDQIPEHLLIQKLAFHFNDEIKIACKYQRINKVIVFLDYLTDVENKNSLLKSRSKQTNFNKSNSINFKNNFNFNNQKQFNKEI